MSPLVVDAVRPDFAGFEKRLMRAIRATARGPAEVHATLDRMRACMLARELLPEHRAHSFDIDLDAIPDRQARDAVARVAHEWVGVRDALAAELRAREHPPTGPLVELEALAGAKRYDELIEVLEALSKRDPALLVDAIGIAEAAGHQARSELRYRPALSLFRLALLGYQVYASWATSGGEGVARMADVERLQATVAALGEELEA